MGSSSFMEWDGMKKGTRSTSPVRSFEGPILLQSAEMQSAGRPYRAALAKVG